MLSPLQAVQFLRPVWLLALLLLPLLAWAWRARQRRRSSWRTAVDPHLLPHLLDAGARGRGAWGGGWLVLAGCALLVLALAGPSWRSSAQPLQAGGAPLVIALDLSSATLANDLPPSRLLQARARIDALLRAHAGEVALVAYADDAYTIAPMTRDAGNVAVFLDALAPDVMPVDGSKPARAIALAQRLLAQSGHARGDILLLAGSGSRSATSAAADARAAGYRVSVLGMGTAAGAAYRRRDGGIHSARLDVASLRAIADAGGGRYHAWSESVPGVLAAIGGGEHSGDADQAATPTIGGTGTGTGDGMAHGPRDAAHAFVREDGGFWLLPPAMLLLLLAFRRGGVFVALLLCLALPPPPLLAAEDSAGVEATVWRRADQVAHARSAEAEAAYRRGDYEAAARGFARLPGADAAYNRGNALARLGRYEDALAAYDAALKAAPGMADAAANRAAVEAAMRRKPPPGAKGDSRGDGKDTPERGKPQPGQAGAGQGDADDPSGQGAASQEPADSAPARRDGEAPPPPSTGTGEQQRKAEAAQREADAAQREAMQRALEDGRPATSGADAKGEPEQARDAGESEQAQANAAWLQRVPDDPGGLLRARLRIEHERRRAEGK
nr:VWA domain-containing protein [Luteimonas sp. MC1825]